MAYDKPKIDIINKKFETLNKGLSQMYSDVQKNQAAIRKRNKTQQDAEISKLKKYQDRFIKGTQKEFSDARQVLSNIDNDDNKTAFTQDLNDQFKFGLQDIKKLVETGNLSDADLEAEVQRMISSAEDFTNGLIGANQWANKRDGAFKKNATTGGTGVGSLVIDDNYPKILGTLGGAADGNVDFGNLRIHGRLSDKNGVSIFTDKGEENDDGEMVYDGEMQEGEILNLKKIGADYKSGKKEPYTVVKSFKDYKSKFQQVINEQKQNQAYYKKIVIEDADGNKTEKYYIDTKARNKYWIEGDGKAYVDEAFNSNTAAMIQKVGGTELLADYTALEGDTSPEAQEKRQQIELIAKTAFVENIGGDLQPDKDKALNSKSFSSGTTYTYDNPGETAVYEYAKSNHDETKTVLYGAHQGASPINIGLAGMNSAFKGKYIKADNGPTGHGKILNITETGPNQFQIEIALNKDGSKTEMLSYDLPDNNARKLFERDILWGQFPTGSDSETLMGMVDQANKGNTKYKGKTRTSTRSSGGGSSGPNAVSESEGEAAIQDSKDAMTSEDMLIEYFNGGNEEDEADETDETVNNPTTEEENETIAEEGEGEGEGEEVVEEEVVEVDYTIDNDAGVVATYNSAAYQDDPGTNGSNNTAQEIKDGLAKISDPNLDFEEIGMKFETLGGAATSSTGGLVGIDDYNKPKHNIPDAKKAQYKNTYDYYLNDKDQVGSKDYAGGRKKHGLKVDLEVDVNGTKTDVYDQLPEAAQEVLRTQHFNQTWDPRYTLLMATGMVDDRSKLKDKDETDKLYKKMIEEGKLTNLNPQAVLDSYIELAKRSHDGGVRSDGLGAWYPQYVERARYLAARNGLKMPANFDKAENELYTKWDKSKYSGLTEKGLKDLKNLFRKNPEITNEDAKALVFYDDDPASSQRVLNSKLNNKGIAIGEHFAMDNDGDGFAELYEMVDPETKDVKLIKTYK